ncbi:MAG TPA: RNase adapter RapZ [Burkholderiales bacterium]|nr:RNase adapter RapZ [Burkholderiales bacterium]
MQLVLITGLSGSGKSVALNVLEDSGYYYVDGLPGKLLPQLVDHLAAAGRPRAAVAIEERSADAISELPRQLDEFRRRGIDLRVLFLEAKTDTLIKRFSETRRRHPLYDGVRTLPECIEREREFLSGLADLAHRVDTSDLTANVLRNWVKDFVTAPPTTLTLLFESFGYKDGIPLDADLVFDVRCLPNPHYDANLRHLTGLDRPVIDFLCAEPACQKMYEDIHRFVAEWLPSFERDSRSYFTVAIGCTGGRHRSVYLVEALAASFRGRGQVLVRHRGLS